MEIQLESQLLATPLGIRFWDPVRGREVLDQLTVTAMREGGSGRVTRAVKSQAGVFVFHGLEGLAEPVLPEQEGAEPGAAQFLVEVRDGGRRFHAMRFRVPAPHRGLWAPEMAGSPASWSPGAFLLSAPTRVPPPGAARVRADLWNAVTDEAAAFALLEVEIKGRLWYGMADREGRAVVVFPYPTPEVPPGSPPPPQPIAEQTWQVRVTAYLDPQLGVETREDVPPEQDLVRSQPAARIHPDPLASPPADPSTLPFSLDADLEFGTDLILRSGTESLLYLTPETSP